MSQHVPNKVKSMNVKVFNFMSKVNGTRFLVDHKSCECKCRSNGNVCNLIQKWDHGKCRCKFKELID